MSTNATETGPPAASQRGSGSLAAFACFVGLPSLVVTAVMQVYAMFAPWEYKVTSPADGIFEREINKEGAAGWEMVNARRVSESKPLEGPRFEIIWKRRSR